MIEINEIFDDSDSRLAFWCDSVADTNDLAIMADDIIKSAIHLISLPSDLVPLMWVYLERAHVKILTRFDFAYSTRGSDSDMYELARDIRAVCKKGASGVQIFISMHDFEKFVEEIALVRDDLFFNHDLCIFLDISDIDIGNWQMIFEKLRDIRVHAFGLTLKEDMKNRSDFVGRIYGMLQNWNGDFELHLALNNNFDRMDQVVRLVESERPELSDKLHFFLDY